MKKTILALALIAGGASAEAQDSLNTDGMRNTTTSDMSLDESQIKQSSTGNYNAFGPVTTVPSHTQGYLMRDYPTAGTATWQQSNNWYRATFLQNNRNMMVYYAPNGDNYAVALPVIQSFVPEEVVTSALNSHGNNVYSINRMRGANGQEVYAVTLLENGVSRTEYLMADGSSVAGTDVYLSSTGDAGLYGSTMDNNVNTNTGTNTNTNTNMNTNTGTDVNMIDDVSGTITTGTDVSNTTELQSGSMNNAKVKTKVETSDGREIKTKTKNGKTRVKEKGHHMNNPY
jgi:hypothetical protein